jgi:uncharacterized protein YndB with AHSA1/START domain
MPEEPTGQPGISITRVFDAPRERLWREWTEPEAFADWFGGPDCEVPLSSVSMDVRAGGAWRLTMFASGREILWTGEYLEVDEPERLVFSISDQTEAEEDDIVVVVLTDLGDGRTEMLFEQHGRRPPEAFEPAKRGWGMFFDRIDERLA